MSEDDEFIKEVKEEIVASTNAVKSNGDKARKAYAKFKKAI